MRASLLILNHNGKPLLNDCFGSLAAATDEGRAHDVYLIDNASNDGSCDYVSAAFPWVKLIRCRENRYLFSYNRIIERNETDDVVLLNNDIVVEADFVEPLLEQLREPDVFAVNARVLGGDRVTTQGSRTSGGFHRGMWWYRQLPDVDRVSTSFFALGGQAAFSRQKFIELGGFDELFWPLYHEDIDLSFRAWRRGWRVLYEPASVIYHFGGRTTASRYQRSELRSIVTKHSFLFQWKNIDDGQMRKEHALWVGPRLARAVLKGDVAFLRGFARALRWRGAAEAARQHEAHLRRIGDRDAFARIMAGIDGTIEAAIA